MDSFLKLLIVALAIHTASASIDVENIVDFCSTNFITQDFNSSWENARDRHLDADTIFYAPLTSKFNIYVMTQYLYQARNYKLLTEAQLENSCLSLKKINGYEHIHVLGYGKSRELRIFPTAVPKVYRFDLPMPDGTISGYGSIALTDNESYTVFDYCYDNGLRSFIVVSTVPFLDDVSLKVIKTHLKSIGFKEKNFVEPNYQGCFDADGKATPDVDNLPIPEPIKVQPALAIVTHNFLHPTLIHRTK